MDDFGKDVVLGDLEMEGKDIHLVTSPDSSEFALLIESLNRTSIIALDAEWKPTSRYHPTSSRFPTVCLLQIACQISSSPVVFLLDLLALTLPLIYDLLNDTFHSPHILKLGFRFKQDMVYLSATFCAQGCDTGFDRVEPYLDISSIYDYMCPSRSAKNSKDTNSLATICRELLGISLSKELQCSDWSCRPLTEGQKSYAAADVWCLLELFAAFQLKIAEEGSSSISNTTLRLPSDSKVNEESDLCDNICKIKLDDASQILIVSAYTDDQPTESVLDEIVSKPSSSNHKSMENSLLKIVQMYGEKLLLDDATKKRKSSKGKKRQPTDNLLSKSKFSGFEEDCLRLPPWDPTLGGDGCAKFLCDVMVKGLAKHLRCVGIDAAVPTNKLGARRLINQAYKEKRVLLTRDVKVLRCGEHLIPGQIYEVKNLSENDQLLEVIETFQLKINEDPLMPRCTECNGSFIQTLSTEEAVEAAEGFQKIPSCLYNKDIKFWQCGDCDERIRNPNPISMVKKKRKLKKQKLKLRSAGAAPVREEELEAEETKAVSESEPQQPAERENEEQETLENEDGNGISSEEDEVEEEDKNPVKKVKEEAQVDEASDEDEDEDEFEDEPVEKLIEPFSKEQLAALVKEAVEKFPKFAKCVLRVADADPTHRKIFVHGLGWDATAETLISVFGKYGEIEDCKAVTGKNTGKSKGYPFILFKHRSGAKKALMEPQKKIGARMTSCRLASAGPVPSQAPTPTAVAAVSIPPPVSEYTQRKIFVSNVAADIDPGKLLEFFKQFGEVEEGPLGLDKQTSKPKGFALFVYKTVEGARKALEEPHKNFEGHTLHCQKAIDGPKNNKFHNQQQQYQNQPNYNQRKEKQQQQHKHQPRGHAPIYGQGHLMAPAQVVGGFNPAVAAQATMNPALGQALTALTASQGQGGGMGLSNLQGNLGGPSMNQTGTPVMQTPGYMHPASLAFGTPQMMQGGYQNPQMGKGSGSRPPGRHLGVPPYMGHR